MSTPTPSRGIGRGGNREGAGRPLGSIDRKARGVIIEAEREGLQMPIDLLLATMRDPEIPLRDRVFCAVAVAPYVHAKRALVRVIPAIDEMNDEQLVEQVEVYERYLSSKTEAERYEDLERQLQSIVAELPRLRRPRQEALRDKVIEAAEEVRRLTGRDPPGTVVPRREAAPAAGGPAQPRAPEAAPASSASSRSARQQAPEAMPKPPDGRRLRYDPTTRKLEEA